VSGVLEMLLPARLGASFRWLLAAFWTTSLGDGVALASGPLLVASLTRDPFLVSLAALLRWAPPLVFGLYAGVLSDRLNRRRIVMVADAVRVGVLVVLVLAIAAGRVTALGVLLALGLLATAEVFTDNTSMTLIPTLVHRDHLALANSRVQTGFITFNQLLGPPIGAALFAAGRAWPFVSEAVLVTAGIALVSRVVLPARTSPDPPATDQAAANQTVADQAAVSQARTGGSVRHDIAEGLRWTVRHPAVRTLVLTILIFNITFGAAWSVLVLYAQQRLGVGPVGYGLLTTVSAVGGLVGTGLYGWITRRVSLGNVMRIGLIIETLTHLALAVTTSAWIAGGIFFVFGAHAFIWGTTSLTVRQRAVPTELQGRVGSVNTIGTFGGLVIGSAIGGTLATRAGITAPFWLAFAGSAVFVVLLWRELTRIAHADAAGFDEAGSDATTDVVTADPQPALD
jgi:MFS family permease